MIAETVEDAIQAIGSQNYKNTALRRQKCRQRAAFFIDVQVEHRQTVMWRITANAVLSLGNVSKCLPHFLCFAKDNMAKNSEFTIDNQSNKSYNKSAKEKTPCGVGKDGNPFATHLCDPSSITQTLYTECLVFVLTLARLNTESQAYRFFTKERGLAFLFVPCVCTLKNQLP